MKAAQDNNFYIKYNLSLATTKSRLFSFSPGVSAGRGHSLSMKALEKENQL